jgi:hypothetical protein
MLPRILTATKGVNMPNIKERIKKIALELAVIAAQVQKMTLDEHPDVDSIDHWDISQAAHLMAKQALS